MLVNGLLDGRQVPPDVLLLLLLLLLAQPLLLDLAFKPLQHLAELEIELSVNCF